MKIPQLETPRLILRERSPKVLQWVFDSLSEAAQKEFLGTPNHSEYLLERSRYREGYSTWYVNYLMWDLIFKESGEIIGRCGYHNWYQPHQRAELGYFLNETRHEGLGLMTEALTEVIRMGFVEIELNRIEALIDPHNAPSLRLVEKFGFIQEGRLRQHYYQDGQVHDSLLFALLKFDYQKKPQNRKM
jgi:ribosomal-protein-alanine N-acetyltransferase